MPIIAPSVLSANFLHLNDACEMINASKAEWFHLDVMDGRFVPNISFGMPVIAAIRKATNKVCDVHLMIEEPEKYTETFKQIGADILTVHVEACKHLHRNLQQIRSLNMKSGIALNPHTPIKDIEHVMDLADLVCVMTVNPGFGGQQFISSMLPKIEALKELIIKRGYDTKIEVDGGVTIENAKQIVNAGADVLVAGNTVFGSKDPIKMIEVLSQLD
jgi:ribulose-phosphate 3-epimerase